MPETSSKQVFGYKKAPQEDLRRFSKITEQRSLVCSDHVNAAAFAVELHLTIGQSEEGVILTAANTHTWMHFGAALANDDVARNDALAARLLDAEASSS